MNERLPTTPCQPEEALVQACALRADPRREGVRIALEELARSVRQWDHVIELAERTRVVPLLASRVAALGDASVPAAIRERLRVEERARRGRALHMGAELLRAAHALSEAGIDAVPFKGPAFEDAFGEGAAHRDVADIDFLVRPRDIVSAVRVLRDLGYACALSPEAIGGPWLPRVANELGLHASAGRVLLELHWRLAAPWSPVAIGAEQAMASARPCALLGGTILCAGREETFLMHLTDGMKAGGGDARWLGDLQAILRGEPLDWDRVFVLATRARGLAMVLTAMLIVEEAYASMARRCAGVVTDLPPEVTRIAAGARGDGRLRRCAASARTRREAGERDIVGPGRNFAWAIALADDRARVAAAIAGHLLGPSLADLAAQGPRTTAASLRWRATRRRFTNYVTLRS
jgi:hypothetical protein